MSVGVVPTKEVRTPSLAKDMALRMAMWPGAVPNAFTLIELLVTVAVIGLVASLLMPALSGVKARAKSVRCLSNLRQLGLGVRVYADENEGRVPRAQGFTGERNRAAGLPLIQEVLAPQVNGVRDVFRCPADNSDAFAREGSSYEWNVSLNGRILHRIGEAGRSGTKVFLLRDHERWHARSRKNAVFVDGHAGPDDL